MAGNLCTTPDEFHEILNVSTCLNHLDFMNCVCANSKMGRIQVQHVMFSYPYSVYLSTCSPILEIYILFSEWIPTLPFLVRSLSPSQGLQEVWNCGPYSFPPPLSANNVKYIVDQSEK